MSDFPDLKTMLDRYSIVLLPDGGVLSKDPLGTANPCPGVDIQAWLKRSGA